MTILRVNAGSWGIGDKLTSAQANGLDLNGTYALDKRAGQTDTLESVVSCATAGRIIATSTTGANANTTYQADGGNTIIRLTSAISANRNYTLSATNAVAGDVVTIFSDSALAFEITVLDQASATMFVVGNADTSDGQWASFIYLSGWHLFHGGQGSRFRSTTFTSNGTWVAPSGVTQALLIGFGGGGGGGGGNGGSTSTNNWLSGGSGGGGSLQLSQRVTVVPGTSYSVTIGAGGGGGSLGFAGGNGGGTSFGSLASFLGAQKGKPAYLNSSSSADADFVPGGECAGNAPGADVYKYTSNLNYPLTGVASGGWAGTPNFTPTATFGGNNPTDQYAGGAAGSAGTDSGSYRGGGAGGGGGGGPGGVGGSGGSGGNGNNAGAATSGTAGTAAAANTGGGGGGGGAGAYGSGAGGAGGTGGAGGSGLLTVIWVK